MKRNLFVTCILLFCTYTAPANVVVPTDAVLLEGTVRQGFGPENLINGSELINEGYTTGDPLPETWSTVIQSPSNAGDLLTQETAMAVQFDLGGFFEIAGVVFWNYTGGDWSHRGLGDTTIFASDDAGATWTEITTVTLVDNAWQGVTESEAQPFDLEIPFPVNAIKISGTNAPSSSTSAGLNEVVFIGVVDCRIPSEPVPASASELSEVPMEVVWKGSCDAVSYDVYLGTDYDVVATGTPEDGSYLGNIETTTMPVALNERGMTYYWRVDAIIPGDPENPIQGPVWRFFVIPFKAYNSQPGDGARYVAGEPTMRWKAGLNALAHQVYFSADRSEVENGTKALLQLDTTYLPGELADDTTYYWRVDEFTPQSGTVRGDIWSFSTVPTFPEIADMVGWWKADAPEAYSLVDYSGHGLHGRLEGHVQWTDGMIGGAMALEGAGYAVTPVPVDVTTESATICAWIRPADVAANNRGIVHWRGEESKVGGLNLDTHNALGYNWNDDPNAWGFESNLFIPKNEWSFVALVVEPTQAALYGYDLDVDPVVNAIAHASTIVDAPLTVGHDTFADNRRFNGLLDDIRIYTRALSVAELQAVKRGSTAVATGPSPALGTIVDNSISTLSWTKADGAASQQVYLGTDRNKLDLLGETSSNSIAFTPMGGEAYYWQVDGGTIWHFSVFDGLIVEDFEAYTEAESQESFLVWSDGFEGNPSGSLGTHENIPWLEMERTHNGGKAMPLYFTNNGSGPNGATYSEVNRTPAHPDLTRQGMTSLVLWYRGATDNQVEETDVLYIALEDTSGKVQAIAVSDSTALTKTSWTQVSVPLRDFTGVNVSSVAQLIVGVGNRTTKPMGGQGLVYLDDLALTKD